MDYFRQRFLDELNDEGDIEIRGLSWTRQQVIEGLETSALDDLFSDWVSVAKSDAKERVREFLTETKCLDRFRMLTTRIRNGQVLPFIGAGMSIASGFKSWGTFLLSLLADAPQIQSDVERMLSGSQYEEAAQLVHDILGRNVFAEEIHNQLGSHRRGVSGPISLIPKLFADEVLTTNFDYVVTNAYGNADLPFQNEFCGIRLREARQRIGNNPHCLLRLHGEADAQEGRVLTRAEYEKAYNGGVSLTNILGGMVGARSLLFMGSSLQSDRTYLALRDIRSAAADSPTRHYAFLPCPNSSDRAARRAFLSEAEIHPIYYPARDHDQCIEDLLITLMEGGLDD